MKTIIDFEPSLNAKKDDLLVYDAYNKRFVQITKQAFLAETDKKIESLQKENGELQLQIKKLQEDLTKIARILKGEIRWRNSQY